MKKYYVYQHIRDDKQEIFYIGIGTRSKQDIKCNTYHRASAKHIDNNIWLKIVAKTSWRFEILFESELREEVEDMEIKLIIKYGRKCDKKGILANLTLGGESNKGYIFTEEQRKKISDSQRGKPGRRLGKKLTEEQKKRMSTRQKEIANRPEMIEFRRGIAVGNSWHTGKFHSEESKKKMSESAKKRSVNSKTVKCKLTNILTGEFWESISITGLSKICPLTISVLNKLANNYRPNKKITEQYKFERYE